MSISSFYKTTAQALILTAVTVGLLVIAQAQVRTSPSYQLQSDSINFGGGLSSSTNYSLESTAGEIATGDSNSTTYRLRAGYQQMQEVFLSMTDAQNVTMSPSLGGLTGGTSNGSTSVSVLTDSPSGYQLTIQSASSPAMQYVALGATIADYVASNTPAADYTFTATATQAHFGFSPEGSDIVDFFRDNGVATCGVGVLDTTLTCWKGLTISEVVIAEGPANQPSGATTTVNFRVGVGSSAGVIGGDLYSDYDSHRHSIMKKITSRESFFVKTVFFFVTVHLVPLLRKNRFASKLSPRSNFFTKNIFIKTGFFVKRILSLIAVHLVSFFEKKRFASKLSPRSNFYTKNRLTKTIFFAPAVFLVSLIFVPALLLAQVSSEFTISTQVVDDSVPPTTPTMLSVIPVAYDQIDVTWSVSTDNFQLDGYVLLRDGTPIATTTLTTYMDTGLTASTTYSYEVYAFDTFYNLSTTSNALATTTLDVPPTPPAATTTSPTNTTATKVLRLESFEINTGRSSANFLWETNNPSRFTLRWGRSDAYDEGYILNDIYRRSHQTLVGDLEPGTVYLYELIGYGNNGIAISLKKGEFKTAASASEAPPNVQNLQAVVLDNDVTLSWNLPPSFTDGKVRIVRSHLGYPVDPYDGAVVYEGQGNSFFDRNALETYGSQYYTVFVLGSDGSVSSGAVVKAKRKSTSIPSSTSSSTEVEEDPFEEEVMEIPDFGFSVENIKIKQGENLFDFKSERIFISQDESFIISIPFSSLPKHLKSIIVTLMDPTNQRRSYSFLLRINKDRTAYEATIAPIRSFGASRLQIEIYDFERQIIGRYRKQIDFVSNGDSTEAEVIFPDKIVGILGNILSPLFWIFLVILLILILLYRRSKEAEDNR